MSATAAGRVVRTALVGTGALLGTLGALIATAGPAAAHSVGGGELPAPPWLLSYVGAFAVAATAVALRATWPAPRFSGLTRDDALEPEDGAAVPAAPSVERAPLGLHLGHALGLGLLVLVFVAALVGPDSAAANVAPVAVLVVWWVGLPILCLVAGDVMKAINPFVGIVGALQPGHERMERRPAPTWTGAAFLLAFAWFFIAYHRPGSPRSLAVFLAAYVLAAVLGGLVWGRRWLATGEGFGALSAAVALISPWRRHTAPPPGLAALMVVWLGSTAFDAFTSTPFWIDVIGASQGWSRTFLHSVGLAWMIAVVAGIYLGVLRLAGRSDEEDPTSIAAPLGVALGPLAVSWFLAHDLTLLLFEGQNFVALMSDPIGEGWDLFGTITRTIDYGLVQATWVRWVQLALLGIGHVAAVVLGHDLALQLVRRRAAMAITWGLAGAAAISIVAAALMVLG
jgi:hypothetical protein